MGSNHISSAAIERKIKYIKEVKLMLVGMLEGVITWAIDPNL